MIIVIVHQYLCNTKLMMYRYEFFFFNFDPIVLRFVHNLRCNNTIITIIVK